MILALWTSQRQGDPWQVHPAAPVKDGRERHHPVVGPLKAALDEAARSKVGPLILVNSKQRTRSADTLGMAWHRACRASGINGLTFRDLRGTAVTRLAIAGCIEAEIASVAGHTLRDVRSILDRHYLHLILPCRSAREQP
jgi:integrase